VSRYLSFEQIVAIDAEEPAALFESLPQNYPFLDGNKRTAITATGVSLVLNGYSLLSATSKLIDG